MKTQNPDKETRNSIWLGLFVLVGLALLTIGVYFIGAKKDLFTSTFRVTAHFSDISGLQNGEAVRFRGISVGTVKEINVVNDSTVEVVMALEKKLQPFIKKNAIASIVTDGLMGNKLVNLRNDSTRAEPIAENDNLKTLPMIDMEDVSRKLKTSNDKIAVIANNLADITTNIKKGKGVVGTLLTDTAFAKDLNRGVKNLEAGASNINQETEALKHTFLFKRALKKQEEDKKKQKK